MSVWINTGMVDSPKVVTNPSTNRARHSLTSLMWRTPLPLSQTSRPPVHLYSATSRTCRLSSDVVTNRASVQTRPQPKPAFMDFDLQPCSPSLPFLIFFTTVIHVNTWITTHSPTQEGWKAELA